MYEIKIIGLPATLETDIFIDGQHETTVSGGGTIRLSFNIDTSHTIEVESRISINNEIRYICLENSESISTTCSLLFNYHKECYLSVSSNPSNISLTM